MTITWYRTTSMYYGIECKYYCNHRNWSVIAIIGIGVELPSSELELNCLRDFVPESELNWNCFLSEVELELNCKNVIVCFPSFSVIRRLCFKSHHFHVSVHSVHRSSSFSGWFQVYYLPAGMFNLSSFNMPKPLQLSFCHFA